MDLRDSLYGFPPVLLIRLVTALMLQRLPTGCCGCTADTDQRIVRCFPRTGPSLYDVPDGAEVRVAWFAEKRTDTFVVIEQERILPVRCRFTHEIRC